MEKPRIRINCDSVTPQMVDDAVGNMLANENSRTNLATCLRSAKPKTPKYPEKGFKKCLGRIDKGDLDKILAVLNFAYKEGEEC